MKIEFQPKPKWLHVLLNFIQSAHKTKKKINFMDASEKPSRQTLCGSKNVFNFFFFVVSVSICAFTSKNIFKSV